MSPKNFALALRRRSNKYFFHQEAYDNANRSLKNPKGFKDNLLRLKSLSIEEMEKHKVQLFDLLCAEAGFRKIILKDKIVYEKLREVK